jgi:acetate kinase
MRTLRASHSQDADFAIDLFTHRVIREIGALTACIGGLDVLAFTGGIGEHDAILRQKVAIGLGFLGISVDVALNMAARGDAVRAIHEDDSSVEVWVIPTDEGRIAAQEALALCL